MKKTVKGSLYKLENIKSKMKMYHNITLKNLMSICTFRFLKLRQRCVRERTLNSDQVLQLVKLIIFMSFWPFFLLT